MRQGNLSVFKEKDLRISKEDQRKVLPYMPG